MKSVILAAGKATRLYPLTKEMPKSLLVVGDKTILEHQFDSLRRLDLSEVVVVTGYLSGMLEQNINVVSDSYPFSISLVHNPLYADTNNIYSLWLAKDRLIGEPFLCLHADVLFDPAILDPSLTNSFDICLVADDKVLEETMKIRVEDGKVTSVGKHVTMQGASGTFLGLAWFSTTGSNRMFQELEKIVESGQTNGYFTDAVEELIRGGLAVGACSTRRLPWIEIDFPEELEEARTKVYPKISQSQL